MRLSISNIAWDVSEDQAVGVLLRQFGLDAIDVAPGKYFPDPSHASNLEIARVRASWADRGIEIIGMQALLFGTAGLNIFGSQASQEAMFRHLDAICRIGAGLGAQLLVFGSPRNRDRTGLDDQEAIEQAVPFFRRLGDIAKGWDLKICLEPNPPCYGANFMVTSFETAAVVERVSHPAIGMQLDTGALTISGERAWAVIEKHAALIGHIHVSEPNLVPIGDGAGTNHAEMALAISCHLPKHSVAIEMLATKEEPHLKAVERALGVVVQHYRLHHD